MVMDARRDGSRLGDEREANFIGCSRLLTLRQRIVDKRRQSESNIAGEEIEEYGRESHRGALRKHLRLIGLRRQRTS